MLLPSALPFNMAAPGLSVSGAPSNEDSSACPRSPYARALGLCLKVKVYKKRYLCIFIVCFLIFEFDDLRAHAPFVSCSPAQGGMRLVEPSYDPDIFVSCFRQAEARKLNVRQI